MCAILNSETLRTCVQQYQARGQWGARHFDKYVFNLPIPRFERGNAVHRALADAGQTAADVALSVPSEEGEYFTRTRKRIRKALAEHGVAGGIDRLTAQLLDATAQGLPPSPEKGARGVRPAPAQTTASICPIASSPFDPYRGAEA